MTGPSIRARHDMGSAESPRDLVAGSRLIVTAVSSLVIIVAIGVVAFL